MISEKENIFSNLGPSSVNGASVAKMELLGIGSTRCQQLKQNLSIALKTLGIQPQVDEITDIDELMKYDVGGIPALIADGQVLFQRVVPSPEDIIDVLKGIMEADKDSRERIVKRAVLAEVNRKASIMKKILVPTDFSRCSMNALGYAVDIANQFGCKITLLHSYKLYSTAGMFVSVGKYVEKDAAEQLLNIINKVEPKLRNGASIESRLIQGEAVSTIGKLADKSRYDLIIMGTKGASGIKEIFTGSITNGVIKAADTPVIAVPEDFDYQPIDKIVFAVDRQGISNPEVTSTLTKLAKGVGAEVLVFHQASNLSPRPVNPSVELFLDGISPSYHYELNSDDVLESISDFVTECSAGLLCMVRRKRGFLEKVFHKSATSKTVFNSPVPLLVLKDEM
jgi:nucleotide-binding universal stress UspA family protein